MRKRKKKRSAASLKNLVPGGNLRHGAFQFLRTGRIPPGHQDIAEEAERFEKDLKQEYCQPGNMILGIVQGVPIRQLVSNFVFSELLIMYLWRQVSQADSEKLGAVLALPGWMTWMSASNRMRRLFRQLRRNLHDFRFDKGKNTSLDDYLDRKY